jgi:oxygen-dependent protoporphyrinogen oxidase
VLDPLIGGIYGGDTRRLSVAACLPRLRTLERAYGSVTLGMRHAMRVRRRRAAAGDALWPPLVTLRRGMGSLPAAMARGLDVRLGTAVTALTRTGGGFRLAMEGCGLDAAAVVVATPAWRAARIVADVAPDLADALAAVPHKAVDCVTLIWERRDVPHPLAGTGWVRAADDARPTLACTWASEKWPDRAPHGFVLLRSVVALPDADDGALVAAAVRDIRDLLGVTAAPCFAVVRRLARATPIYELGHAARVAAMERLARELGPLALAGNAYHGVGIPDCIASGEAAAGRVLDALAPGAPRRLAARG